MFYAILKANPYHDTKGRFAPKGQNAAGASKNETALKDAHGVSVAAPGSKADALVGGAAFGGPIPKKTAISNKAWQGTVKDFKATLDDLSSRFGMDFKGMGLVLLSRDAGATGSSGLAMVGGKALSFNSNLQSRKNVAEEGRNNELFAKDNNGRNWGVPEGLISGRKVTEAVRQEYVQAVMRHEVGHLLTSPSHVRAFNSAMKEMGATRKWAKENLSVYGASNTTEALAEAFSKYTDKGYKKGTLPASVEGIMEDMMSTTKKTTKKEAGYVPASLAQDNVPDDAGWDDEPAKEPSMEQSPKGFKHVLNSNTQPRAK